MMIDDTLENILREIGVIDRNSPWKVMEPDVAKEAHVEHLKPGYFNNPLRDEHGEVCF